MHRLLFGIMSVCLVTAGIAFAIALHESKSSNSQSINGQANTQPDRHDYAVRLDTVSFEMGETLRAVGEGDIAFSAAEDRASKSIDVLAPLTLGPTEMNGIEDMRKALELLTSCHRGYSVFSLGDLKGCLAQWRSAKDKAFDELGAPIYLKGLTSSTPVRK